MENPQSIRVEIGMILDSVEEAMNSGGYHGLDDIFRIPCVVYKRGDIDICRSTDQLENWLDHERAKLHCDAASTVRRSESLHIHWKEGKEIVHTDWIARDNHCDPLFRKRCSFFLGRGPKGRLRIDMVEIGDRRSPKDYLN